MSLFSLRSDSIYQIRQNVVPLQKRNGEHLSVLPKPKRRKCKSESSSEDESIEYMDSDNEQRKDNKSNIPVEDDQENKREAYIQPDMKEWIPVSGQAEMIKTTIVRLPTQEEIQACQMNSTDDGDAKSPTKEYNGSIRCTMLNQLGYPVQTFISEELQVLDKQVSVFCLCSVVHVGVTSLSSQILVFSQPLTPSTHLSLATLVIKDIFKCWGFYHGEMVKLSLDGH